MKRSASLGFVKLGSGLFLTQSGFIILLVLIAMLIASMNYSNTMAYILCFMIIGLILVSLVYTWNNLTGLHLKSVQTKPTFAGGTVNFTLEIRNISSKKRIAVYLTMPDLKTLVDYFGPFSLEPNSITSVSISVPAHRRGLYTLSSIKMETIFPLGLFRKWQHINVEKEYLVFPRPAGWQPWPPPMTMWFENVEGFHFSGGDDFTGLRPYRLGESQHHIDWKAFARGRPLSVKEFSGGGSFQLWFDWSILANIETESRLSQLTRWVLEADQQGKEFGLKIPGFEIEPDSSSLHTLKCLKALALFNF